MKISASKKQLAKIISENGGWRDGVKLAAQDRSGRVCFYNAKPTRAGGTWWHSEYSNGDWINCRGAQPNWHQTILSRDEYFHLYPAPDADGWIEWRGGECPVDSSRLIDARARSGVALASYPAGKIKWAHDGSCRDLVAYRLLNLEPQYFESVTRIIPDQTIIEQLAAEYRAKLAIAQQAQEEADSHRCVAEAALEKLASAGKELGLVLGVSDHEPELAIKDWVDWRVDDEVVCISTPPGAKCFRWLIGAVSKILDNGVEVVFSDRKCCAYGDMVDECFKFIRRP